MRVQTNKAIRHGKTTSTGTNKLIDSAGKFISDVWTVRIGDVAIREVDDGENLYATVTNVDSDTELTLSSNIFTSSNQPYTILVGDVYLTGTATSTEYRKLVDSSASFASRGVRVGMVAYNKTNKRMAWVLEVGETSLTLTRNIFSAGNAYEVYSGDTFFGREYEELRLRKFLIAGDDTEVSVQPGGAQKIKELLCSSSSAGYLIKGLRAVIECKSSAGGSLTIYIRINGVDKSTISTNSSQYSIRTAEINEEFADNTVLDIDIYASSSAGTGYVRLTEIYAIV